MLYIGSVSVHDLLIKECVFGEYIIPSVLADLLYNGCSNIFGIIYLLPFYYDYYLKTST